MIRIILLSLLLPILVTAQESPFLVGGGSQQIHQTRTPEGVIGDNIYFIERPAYSDRVWVVHQNDLESDGNKVTKHRMNNSFGKALVEDKFVTEDRIYLFYTNNAPNTYALYMQILDVNTHALIKEATILTVNKSIPGISDKAYITCSANADFFSLHLFETKNRANTRDLKTASIFLFNKEGVELNRGSIQFPEEMELPYELDPARTTDYTISNSGRCAIVVAQDSKKGPQDRRFFCYELTKEGGPGLKLIDYAQEHKGIYDLRISYCGDTLHAIVVDENSIYWYLHDMNGKLHNRSNVLRAFNPDNETIVGYFFSNNSLYLFTEVVRISQTYVEGQLSNSYSTPTVYSCFDKAVLYCIEPDNNIGFTLMPSMNYYERSSSRIKARGLSVRGLYTEHELFLLWDQTSGTNYATVDLINGLYINQGFMPSVGSKHPLEPCGYPQNSFAPASLDNIVGFQRKENSRENNRFFRIRLVATD